MNSTAAFNLAASMPTSEGFRCSQLSRGGKYSRDGYPATTNSIAATEMSRTKTNRPRIMPPPENTSNSICHRHETGHIGITIHKESEVGSHHFFPTLKPLIDPSVRI